jgi:hypothetical protein
MGFVMGDDESRALLLLFVVVVDDAATMEAADVDVGRIRPWGPSRVAC